MIGTKRGLPNLIAGVSPDLTPRQTGYKSILVDLIYASREPRRNSEYEKNQKDTKTQRIKNLKNFLSLCLCGKKNY